MASWTTFVSGDSYTSPGVSTRTSILDTETGAYVPSLETFTATVDGGVYKSVDTNFWGVTFTADDNTFYATMGSNGRTWLMRGDFGARRMRAVRDNAECPSLSPDGTRLVFKKRVSDDVRKPWHFYVLDLATMKETALAEQRSVDDQAAWLDAKTVMYAVPHSDDPGSDVYSVPADDSGAPALLVANAMSPAVTGG
jgi:dipeptidyl aminopeptidase/acylaminoacyl peptidase